MHNGRVLQRDYIPVTDDRGGYLGQLWKFRDITARTRAEAELRRREEKYRGIIENMSLGLVEARPVVTGAANGGLRCRFLRSGKCWVGHVRSAYAGVVFAKH